jgi:hypothetical protein
MIQSSILTVGKISLTNRASIRGSLFVVRFRLLTIAANWVGKDFFARFDGGLERKSGKMTPKNQNVLTIWQNSVKPCSPDLSASV